MFCFVKYTFNFNQILSINYPLVSINNYILAFIMFKVTRCIITKYLYLSFSIFLFIYKNLFITINIHIIF